MRQSFPASGTLAWGGQSQDVQRVRVELDEDGDAHLKFDGQARDGNWGWRDGDWRNWSANQEIDGVWLRDVRGIVVDLRTGIGGQTVVGSARITLEDEFGRPCPRELTLSGRVVRRPWDTLDLSGRLVFDSWGGNTGGGNMGRPIFNNRLDEFSTIRRGDGYFSDGSLRNNIARADVQLSRDGTAKIVLSGDRDTILGGRWRQTSASRIELRIDAISSQADRRIFDVPRPGAGADFLGGGEIRLDGNRMVALRLSGSRDNHDFEIQFEPQIDNGNGGWTGAGWNGGNGGGVWNGNAGGNGNGGWNGNDGGNWGGEWTGDNGNGNRNGGNRNGGGNWGGGWNGNAGNGNGNHGGDHENGGWNGNGGGNAGNKPHPKPIPEVGPDAWRGWNGGPINGQKGSLPAPSPQAPVEQPVEQHTSGPLRRPSQPSPVPAPESKPIPETRPAPASEPPAKPERPSRSAPAPEPPAKPERSSRPAPAPEPEHSQKPESKPAPEPKPAPETKPAPAPEPPAKTDEKPEKPAPEESSKDKERPHSRVGKPR